MTELRTQGMAVRTGGGNVLVEMEPEEAHEMGCYFYRLSVEDNPADLAKDEMLAILRAAHLADPGCCDPIHDCPEPLEGDDD